MHHRICMYKSDDPSKRRYQEATPHTGRHCFFRAPFDAAAGSVGTPRNDATGRTRSGPSHPIPRVCFGTSRAVNSRSVWVDSFRFGRFRGTHPRSHGARRSVERLMRRSWRRKSKGCKKRPCSTPVCKNVSRRVDRLGGQLYNLAFFADGKRKEGAKTLC